MNLSREECSVPHLAGLRKNGLTRPWQRSAKIEAGIGMKNV